MWRFLSFVLLFLPSLTASDLYLSGYYTLDPTTSCPIGCCCWSDQIMIIRHSTSYELMTTLTGTDCSSTPIKASIRSEPTSTSPSTSLPTSRIISTSFGTSSSVSYLINIDNRTYEMTPSSSSPIKLSIVSLDNVNQCLTTFIKHGEMGNDMCKDDVACHACMVWSTYHHNMDGSCQSNTWKETTCGCNHQTCTCSNSYVASFYALLILLITFVIIILGLFACCYSSRCPCHTWLTRIFCCARTSSITDWFKYHVLRKSSTVEDRDHMSEELIEHETHGMDGERHDHPRGSDERDEYKHGATTKIMRSGNDDGKTEYQKWKEKQDMEDDLAYQELFA